MNNLLDQGNVALCSTFFPTFFKDRSVCELFEREYAVFSPQICVKAKVKVS